MDLPTYIVSVLYQNEGFKIYRVSGNLSAVEDGFPNTSRVLVEHGHSLTINLSTGSGSENPSMWPGKDC